MRPRSPKREAQAGQRDRVRRAARRRAGDRCELAGWHRCWHPAGELLDVHESPRRSKVPGADLVDDLVVVLCRRAHDLDDSDPELAQLLGIRIPLEPYLAYPAKALLQARILRVYANETGRFGALPYWLRPEWAGVDEDRLEAIAAGASLDPLNPLP